MEMTHLKAHEVVNTKFSDFAAIVRYVSDGAKVEIWWTDYVTNEWSEIYDSLAQALTRLALLLECMDSDWEKGFLYNAAQHAAKHLEFSNSNVK